MVEDGIPDTTDKIVYGIRRQQSSSFCVATRIIAQELPSTRSFLEHYASLGEQTFDMVCNQRSEHDCIVNVLSPVTTPNVKVVLHNYRTTGEITLRNMELLTNTAFFNMIEEDFVVGVNIEEFWALPDGIKSLSELTRTFPADIYFMEWFLVPNDQLIRPPVLARYESK
jgi:hypothetical protein